MVQRLFIFDRLNCARDDYATGDRNCTGDDIMRGFIGNANNDGDIPGLTTVYDVKYVHLSW